MDAHTIRKLTNLRLPVISVLHKHYRGVSNESYEDAYSHAIMQVITGEAEYNPDDLMGTLLRPAMGYVAQELNERKRGHCSTCDPAAMDALESQTIDEQMDTILGGVPSRCGQIDYRKLDQRFRTSLSPTRQQLWDLRCQGKQLAEISHIMQRSHGYIAVTEFYMRIAYKTWVKAITRLDHKQTPPKRSITQKIYQLSVQGYTPKQIASQIGVTNVYVSVNLFRLRHRSETKPDT
jgi:hypothetical protein